MEVVTTLGAPTPAGHYAQGLKSGSLLFVSGQVPIDPSTGNHVTGSIEAQTQQALSNVKAIVEAGGSSLNRVLKVTVFITDVSLWGAVNQVYARFFGDHRPARSVVPVKPLHYGFDIEIEAIAEVGGDPW